MKEEEKVGSRLFKQVFKISTSDVDTGLQTLTERFDDARKLFGRNLILGLAQYGFQNFNSSTFSSLKRAEQYSPDRKVHWIKIRRVWKTNFLAANIF